MNLLFYAIKFKQVELVDKLCQIVNVNQCHPIYSYPLFYAVKYSSYRVIYTLLKHHAKINIRDNHGNCILHFTNHPDCAVLFDLNVNQENHYGNTPLHESVIRDNLNMVKYLKFKNAICTKNREGRTPLHYAIINDNIEIVKALKEYWDFNPNVQDKDGNNCLHLAILHQSPKMVSLVKECDCFAKNHYGKNPIECVLELDVTRKVVDMIVELIDKLDFQEEEVKKNIIDMAFMYFYKHGYEKQDVIEQFCQMEVKSFIKEKYLERK